MLLIIPYFCVVVKFKMRAGFTRLSRLARLGAENCSSGAPDPERVKRGCLIYRSAGACPPRAPDPREKRTQTNAVFPIEAWRGTGPRPTVKGSCLIYRSAGACPPRAFTRKNLFRSFRSCMSIVTSTSKKTLRSFRSLIDSTRNAAGKH